MTHRRGASEGDLGAPLLLFALLLAAPAAAGPEAVRRKATVRSTVGPIETPLPLEVANFLLDHPDLSAWLVNRRKIAPYVIEMRGPRESWADDGDGTKGIITLVERSETQRLYYGEGTHDGWIKARAAIGMQMVPVRRSGCPGAVSTTFDVSVRLTNPFVRGAVHALKVFLKDLIISKFSRAFTVAHKVGVLLAKDPEGLTRELAAYPKLSEAERAELLRLARPLAQAPEGCRKGR